MSGKQVGCSPVEANRLNWSDWFKAARTVAPDELSFRKNNGVIVVLVRDEPSSKTLIQTCTYSAIFLCFVVLALFCIDQILLQLLLVSVILIGAYAYTARTRISIETTPICLVAETRHFGRITRRIRIHFQSDASFIARPVGGYQNIENEIVFADQTQNHFCFYVTNPPEFHDVLRDLNAAVRS